jgi:hypothetical protein
MGPDLSPPGLQAPGTQSPTAGTGTGNNNLHRMVWALFGFVVALTLVVLVVLPFMVSDHANDEPVSVSVSAPASTPPPLAAGVARHDAEQALQNFLRMRAQPELANAEVWAAEAWQAALNTAAGGDEHYGRGRFSEALSAYQQAIRQLQDLQAGREQLMADRLKSGWQSLEKNESAAAVFAFEQVLAMQADHEEAGLGLARARVRDEILALMEEGRQAEAVNDPQRAARAYTAASRLDPAYIPVQAALQRVSTELAGTAFQDAMSHALQSLDRGNLTAADEALKAAAQIYPDAPAVGDARRRLTESRRQYTLGKLRKEAARRVSAENWSAAADLYRKALAIDAQAAYARAGLARAQKRTQLHAQLDHYLADTTRLSSDEPLANASKLLEANKHLPESEPRLAAKVAALNEAVRLAVIPVSLLIKSDNRTEVTIYHVGRLGKFHDKQVTLRPGRYTVTGYCPGYRDVRKVITLRPDSTKSTLLVRCEEPI